MKILGIIPARSGSKSIKNKNIRLINGKPLLTYSIEHALGSRFINRVIISTDSKKYGEIAKKWGAEFPFLRPKKISGDFSTDLEVFQHALIWLNENENYTPDICVHLRPTHPVRISSDIDRMVEILIQNPELDSVRSISLSEETPYKMWLRESDGRIIPVVKSNIKEAYNQPRQVLPVTYFQNASIDVIRTSTITKKQSMTGDNVYGHIMDHNWDIDEIRQLSRVRKELK